ncbi:hypothetical protein PR202_gb07761 [Eleusine coracana subsp. coracana]|uniref:Uncharacterized protein n=1 Tax=Eleusine coracana subsp. coracana TaxID=191504 RepID=A0AAV5ECL6_ELECO|nr:hypothetical protein QOZ80_2BG0175620 [Eleusine coracana subsp. coracana]GJN20390.1 hypothetical protein PR202_gb07761 [Eleusine coracana subsp. coracana]
MDETSGDLQWQQGWLAVGMPPGPVLALSGIVTFFLYLTWQIEDYEEQLRRRTEAVLMVLGLLALAVLKHHALIHGEGRLAKPVSWRRGSDSSDGGGAGTSPWVVAAVVAVLLVLASHKPSYKHK